MLLQIATCVIENCDKYYYKLRQVFMQSATIVLKCENFITKCDSRLQRATIITKCDKTNTSYTSFKWDHSFCLEISLGHFSIDMFHSVLEHEHTFICKPDRLKEIYRNNTRNIRSGYVLSLSWRKDESWLLTSYTLFQNRQNRNIELLSWMLEPILN